MVYECHSENLRLIREKRDCMNPVLSVHVGIIA